MAVTACAVMARAYIATTDFGVAFAARPAAALSIPLKGALNEGHKVLKRSFVASIRLRIDGARKIRLRDGDLLIDTVSGQFVMRKPSIYQEMDNGRKEIERTYVLNKNRSVTFRADAYDRARPLVIDLCCFPRRSG